MNTEIDKLTHLVQDIFATRDDEIQCTQARTQMTRAAQALLSDDDARREYPAMWYHFRFCQDCAEEYKMLRELMALETTGQLDYPLDVPPSPDGGKKTIWSLTKEAITAFFPGFAPTLAEALTRGQELGVEPAVIELAHGRLTVMVDVGQHETDPALRNLFINATTLDDRLQTNLDGSLIWLQLGDLGPAIQEQVLDSFGDVAFRNVSPGQYTIRLQVAGEEYGILGVDIP